MPPSPPATYLRSAHGRRRPCRPPMAPPLSPFSLPRKPHLFVMPVIGFAFGCCRLWPWEPMASPWHSSRWCFSRPSSSCQQWMALRGSCKKPTSSSSRSGQATLPSPPLPVPVGAMILCASPCLLFLARWFVHQIFNCFMCQNRLSTIVLTKCSIKCLEK